MQEGVAPNFSIEESGIESHVSDEEFFRHYAADMDLSAEDLKKKILDVGSGSGKFAKWTHEHDINSHIYSLEPIENLHEKSKGVRGMVEQMPFKNEEFDIVISNGAIPMIFAGSQYSGMREDKMREGIKEMLRVTKKGGEVRMWPIVNGEVHEWDREVRNSLNIILEELRNKERVIIEEIQKEDLVHKWDEKRNPTTKEPAFLIKIKKPFL